MCMPDNNNKKRNIKWCKIGKKNIYLLQSCNGIMCIAFHVGIKKDLLVREKTWKGGKLQSAQCLTLLNGGL